MATGCRRVNIGTAALEQPEWCARVIAEYGDRVAIGLDVRGRTLAARGWTREGGDLYEVLARLDARGLCALRRHRRQQGRHAPGPQPRAAAGRLRGHRPPGRGLRRRHHARRHPGADGAGARLGVEGAIAGTALYEGRFTLEDALALTQGHRVSLAVRVIPCLDVDAGRVVKGINFQRAARRRGPGRAGPHLRRRGRRRADLPRHLGLPRGPRDHDGDRVAHAPRRSSSR